MVTIQDMKKKNKEIGHYFFDKGQGKVLPTVYKNKYVIAQNMDKSGYLVWEYHEDSGKLN